MTGQTNSKTKTIYTFGVFHEDANIDRGAHVDNLGSIDASKGLLSEVGGKALSLMVMAGRKLPVPPGFVLSVGYFRPWLIQVKEMEEFALVMDAPSETLKARCDRLKARCEKELQLDADSLKDLQVALENLGGVLYAVRSSSPEEDLAGASFAGGYETTLGVKRNEIKEAIRRSFASCFDERVFRYKQERGFDLDCPTIAVIVQEQVAAESAGVAFSLNPLNNCFDEAVVNANFGLGESVVSGKATPDSFVVDKVTRTLLADSKVGTKEVVVELDREGGTHEVTARAHGPEACIGETQVMEIVDLLEQAANYYGKPIDIEWAYERTNGIARLYLLQARPITAYVPLPDAMLTKPGIRKRLYMDVTLLKQGIQAPFSVLGMDYFDLVQRKFTGRFFGKEVVSAPGAPPDSGLYFNLEGRSYTNISILLKWQGVVRLAKTMRTTDSLSVAILNSIQEDEYTAEKMPPNLRWLTFHLIKSNLRALWSTIKAYWNPSKYLLRYERESQRYLEGIKDLTESHPSLRELVQKLADLFLDLAVGHTLPMTYAAEWARSTIWGLFKDEAKDVQDRLVFLERSFDNNITIEMGLEMFRLAQRSEVAACTSSEEFVKRLLCRSFPPEFLSCWDNFLDRFGCRCPFELDIASARPSENPKAFFEQLKLMAQNATEETNPETVFARAREEREDAFGYLYNRLAGRSSRSAKKFEHCYKVLTTLGGFREVHKYYWVLTIHILRIRVLEEAKHFVASGRLKDANEVFLLHLDELEQALEEPSLDLQPLMETNMEFRNKARNIREYPLCFDSRGKIIRPPRRAAGPGELAGAPISPGVVRGRVKVLRSADEKPLLPGEILAARATDPGWTPLFVNAGGIILEVGGLLQHGALVAREYGKPCVAGIEDVVNVLKDGQMVELDGASGIVRIIDEKEIHGVEQPPTVSQ